jgi:hypothetical protein
LELVTSGYAGAVMGFYDLLEPDFGGFFSVSGVLGSKWACSEQCGEEDLALLRFHGNGAVVILLKCLE